MNTWQKFMYKWLYQNILPLLGVFVYLIYNEIEWIIISIVCMIYGSLQEHHLGIAAPEEDDDDCPEPDSNPEDDLLGGEEPSETGVSEK